jgi:hypothetical protein
MGDMDSNGGGNAHPNAHTGDKRKNQQWHESIERISHDLKQTSILKTPHLVLWGGAVALFVLMIGGFVYNNMDKPKVVVILIAIGLTGIVWGAALYVIHALNKPVEPQPNMTPSAAPSAIPRTANPEIRPTSMPSMRATTKTAATSKVPRTFHVVMEVVGTFYESENKNNFWIVHRDPMNGAAAYPVGDFLLIRCTNVSDKLATVCSYSIEGLTDWDEWEMVPVFEGPPPGEIYFAADYPRAKKVRFQPGSFSKAIENRNFAPGETRYGFVFLAVGNKHHLFRIWIEDGAGNNTDEIINSVNENFAAGFRGGFEVSGKVEDIGGIPVRPFPGSSEG